jgi:DNA-binding transcriptional LysR family regulator
MNRLFEAEAFVLVAEKGSFTAASQRLGITPSYASKLVSRLEDRLGVRLLQRTTRKLSLTEPGRAYYARCNDVMQALEEAESEATRLQQAPRGRLRVTLPTTFGSMNLAGPLAEFKERYPDLAIEAIFTDRQVDVLAEGFDVAIRVGDLSDSSLAVHRLTSVDRALCASEEYLARRGSPARPEALTQHECLRYAYHASPSAWRLKGPGEEVTVEVSGSLIANSGAMLLEAAQRGLGVVYVPLSLAAPYLRDGRLARVLPAWGWPIPVNAVFPNTRHLSAKVRTFVDFVAERLRDPPWSDVRRRASA